MSGDFSLYAKAGVFCISFEILQEIVRRRSFLFDKLFCCSA